MTASPREASSEKPPAAERASITRMSGAMGNRPGVFTAPMT